MFSLTENIIKSYLTILPKPIYLCYLIFLNSDVGSVRASPHKKLSVLSNVTLDWILSHKIAYVESGMVFKFKVLAHLL